MLITPSLILPNDPPLFLKLHQISEADRSPFPVYSSIPRTQIPDLLTIHILAAVAQYYDSLKPNKQPFNQRNGPLFYPKAFYHRRLEHPREPVGITH